MTVYTFMLLQLKGIYYCTPNFIPCISNLKQIITDLSICPISYFTTKDQPLYVFIFKTCNQPSQQVSFKLVTQYICIAIVCQRCRTFSVCHSVFYTWNPDINFLWLLKQKCLCTGMQKITFLLADMDSHVTHEVALYVLAAKKIYIEVMSESHTFQ